MPVTLITANHPSREWKYSRPHATSTNDLFDRSCPAEFIKSKRIIQSSMPQRVFSEKHVAASSNGWVRAAFHAYSGHHHLTVRPEDVWFSILSQLSFYINAHAEELRKYFVEHKGQKELEVKEIGNINSVDFGALSRQMAGLIQENVKDPGLRTWITPDWSTTTEDDRTVASILMMGSMQKYFSYKMTLCCGIPSVTLLGDRADWEDMLKRLDKLPELGDEPAMFASLLRPVLRHFVASFDPEPSPSVIDFWSKIAHETGGSGPHYLSGWITAFCFWDEKGACLYRPGEVDGPRAGCDLGGVFYHRVNTEKIPAGFASVPVLVNDNGVIHHTRMVAGLFGMQVTSSGSMMDGGYGHAGSRTFTRENDQLVPVEYVPNDATEQPGLDSVQPLSGWLMYEVDDRPNEEEVYGSYRIG